MSRTYKDIRLEYRAIRERQIIELKRARMVRRGARDRAQQRQQATHDPALMIAFVMLPRVVERKAA